MKQSLFSDGLQLTFPIFPSRTPYRSTGFHQAGTRPCLQRKLSSERLAGSFHTYQFATASHHFSQPQLYPAGAAEAGAALAPPRTHLGAMAAGGQLPAPPPPPPPLFAGRLPSGACRYLPGEGRGKEGRGREGEEQRIIRRTPGPPAPFPPPHGGAGREGGRLTARRQRHPTLRDQSRRRFLTAPNHPFPIHLPPTSARRLARPLRGSRRREPPAPGQRFLPPPRSPEGGRPAAGTRG